MGTDTPSQSLYETSCSMRILITGTNGFIGRSLKEFYESDHEIIATQRGDHIPTILEKYKPKVIINCAAEIYNADVMFDSNISMVNLFLEWLRNNPSTKMIQIGSSAEYGPMPRATSEQDRINPVDAYQATKGAGTLMCQGYARQFDLDIQIARVYSAYGVYEKPHRLFPKLYNAFVNKEPMTLYNGYHDFIYITDFIRGIDILVNSDRSQGDIINFGSGRQYSNSEVLNLWKDITNEVAPVDYQEKLAKAYESNVWICDTTYAKEKYGFEVEYSLEQGIKDFIRIKNGHSNNNSKR